MAGELGKIEKPGLDQFQGKRKLYVVALIYAGPESPPEYKEKYERYWLQVSEQIINQESKVGNVSRVYHESIAVGGEAGFSTLEKMNVLSFQIIKARVDRGAIFEATEIAELVYECMDWGRCLIMGFYSQQVADTVAGNYREAAHKRYEYISQRINETLKESEIGLLFIREGHAVQFPPDVDVFLVAPPALDEIHRWLRDRREPDKEEDKEEKS